MRKQVFKISVMALGLVGALSLFPKHSHAQMGKMQYVFRSRAEVIPALRKTRGNLRQTYNVLICASRQGYNRTATGYYENLVVGKEFDATPQDCAAFAFSYDLGASILPWNLLQDNAPNLIKKSTRATAIYFRDRAYQMRPTSPEVLVMRAIWLSGQSGKYREQGYAAAQQAVKRAPLWADAYYWLGKAAHQEGLRLLPQTRLAVKNPKVKAQIAHLGRFEMQSYDKAERLDPTLKPQLYLMRIEACNLIADKASARKMLVYVDAHLKAVPEYLIWLRKQRGMDEKQFRGIYQRLADKIEKNAG